MRRAFVSLAALSLASILVSPLMVHADTFTWNNVGTDWGTASNWISGIPGPADVAQFNSATYNFQPNVGELNTVGGVWATGAGSLSVGGSFILTINGTSINGNANTGIELDPGAGAAAFSAPIALGGSQQWLNNSGSALTVTGPLYLGLSNVTFSGSSQTSVSAPITGQGNLSVSPGANLVLSTTGASTANSYVGTTSINGGLLTLQGPATGATIIPQNSPVVLSGGGTLNLNGVSSTILSLGSSDPTSQVQLGTGTLTTGALNTNTFFAAAISGAGGLTKINGTTVILSGSNTYSGATTISAGVLQINGSGLSPNSPISIANGITLNYFNDGTGNNGTISQGNSITANTSVTSTINVGNLTANTGNTVAFGVLANGTSANALASTFNFTGANSYKQSYTGLNLPGTTGNNTSLNATSATVNITGPVINQENGSMSGHFDTLFLQGTSTGNRISGTITNATGGSLNNGDTRITSNGTGQWIISASNNAYTGPTTLTSGSLEFAGNGALPAATAISISTTAIATSLQIRNDGTGNGTTVNLGNGISLANNANTNSSTIDVGSLNGSTSNVTVSFGTLTSGANNQISPAVVNFAGNNGYIANFTKLFLSGSSGANTFLRPMTANVIIGSPATISGTNVVNQENTQAGFDSVILNGTAAGNGGLGNIIYGTINDRAGYVASTSFLQGETNLTLGGSGNGILPTGTDGGGLWTLAGNETYHGWTLINSGTLQLGTGQAGQDGVLYSASTGGTCGITSNGNYAFLRDQGSLIFNNVGNYTISYSVTGAGTLVKLGTDAITLNAVGNAYTGATTISNGTLQVGTGGTLGSIASSSSIVNNGVLAINRSNTVTYANPISGNGTLIQIGGGTLSITGNISGGQSVRQTAGTMILAGNNSYTGATTVNTGILQVNSPLTGNTALSVGGAGILNLNAAANSSTAISVASGGVLNLNAPANAATTISLSGTITGNAAASATSAVATVANGGVLSPGNGGTGTLNMAGLSFSSGGTVNVTNLGNYATIPAIGTSNSNGLAANGAAGAVKINLKGAAPALFNTTYEAIGYSGAIQGTGSSGFSLGTVGMTGSPNGASFTLVNGANFIGVNYSVTGYPTWTGSADTTTWDTTLGNWSNTGGTTTFKSNDLAYFDDTASAGNSNVTINSVVTPYSAYFANNSLSYTLTGSSGIGGGAMLVLNGNGSLTINTSNTYTGGTFLYNGTLNLGNSAALGAATSTLTINGGSIDNTSGGPLTVPNYPMLWNSGFTYVGSSNPLNLGAGGVTLAANATVNVANNTLTVGGAISGAYGLTQTGAGTLLLGGANTYTGNTLVSGGTLMVGNANALQSSTLDTSGAGTVAFGAVTAANVAGLINGGSLTLTNTGGSAVTLTVNNGSANTFSGSLQGLGNLVKIGAGTLNLTGNNTYSGSTAINAGTVQFQGASSLPVSSPVSLATGTTLQFRVDNSGGTASFTGNSITTSNTSGAASSTVTTTINVGSLSGAGTNVVVAFGALNNGTANNDLNSTFTFTGANGYVQSYASLALPGASGQNTTLVPNSSNVIIRGAVTNQMNIGTGGFDTLFLDGTSAGNGGLGNVIYGAIGDSGVLSGVGSGDTRITKQNSSLWTLAGANTYHGPTLISAGTLQLGTGVSGQDGTFGSTSAVTDNANLAYNFANSQTASYAIGGSGNVIAVGNGSVTLNGVNTYTGTTSIVNGTLFLGPAGSFNSSKAISLANNTTLDVSSKGTGFALLSGQTLTGVGNYTVNGAMTINSGATVTPGGVASAGTLTENTALTLSPGSVLKFDFTSSGSVDLISVANPNSLTINGGGISLFDTSGTNQFTTPGVYQLIGYSGVLNGSAGSLSVLNPNNGFSYAFSTSGGFVDLTIAAANFWNGGGNPAFAWSNTANWSASQAPTNGQPVIFAGTVGLSNTNDIASLNAAGITFQNTAGAFTLTGNSVQLSGPIVNSSAATQTIGLSMVLTGGNQTITAASGNIVLAGVLDDAGSGYGITTAGANTITLSAANTFSGPTTVTAGKLDLANGLALQNSTLTLNAGSLVFDNSVASAAFTLGGLGGAGNINLSANITSYPVALTVGGNGASTTYSGVLSGLGSLNKSGSGTLFLNGANTFSGNTLISAGVLQLLNGSALQNSTLDTSGAGQINFGSLTAATVGGLTNGGNLSLLNGSGAAVALSVGNNALYNVSSANISGSGSIVKIGSGLQALAGSNSYTGGTTISAGTLQFLGTTAVNSSPSGGAIGMAAGTTLSVHADGTGSGGTIAVPGSSVTLNAAGTVTFQVGNYLTGNTGNTVSFGVLSNGTTGNGFASTFNITGANGYITSFGGVNLSGSTGQGTTLNPTTSPVVINGPVNNQETGTLTGHFDTLTLGGNSSGNQINGVISDAVGYIGPIGNGDTRVTATGGQWILAASNTYSGPTTISGGTLQLGTGIGGQDGTLGNTSGVTDNAALVYKLTANQAASYAIGGSGSVTVLAGGVTFGASNTYSGATTIASGGSLTLGPVASINNTGKITLRDSAVLDVSQVSPWTLNSAQTLAGTGAYLVNGTVSNAIGSVIQPGTLAANSAGTLTTGGLTLGGGTLSYELGSNQDLIKVTGVNGLNIGSVTAINLFDSSGTNQFTTPGTYPIIAYNGSLGGGVGSLIVGNPSPNAAYTFSTSGGMVDVNILAALAWTGSAGAPFNWSVNGNWSTNVAITTGQLANFQGTTGLTNTNDIAGLNLSGIYFGTTAGAFNLTGNSVQVSGAITNASTATQTISLNVGLSGSYQNVSTSPGSIVVNGVISDGGAGLGINLSGSGALVLGGANTYSGSTTVNSGTLSLANNQAAQDSTVSLSGGALTFASGITSPILGGLTGAGNIALTTAASEAVALNVGSDGQNTTYSGALTGPGGLVKTGADTFTLASGSLANSYSGATLVSGGVLQAGRSSVTSSNSPLTISNASTFDMTNTTQSIQSLSSTDGLGSQVVLGSTGLLRVVGPGVTTFDGVISGAGGAVTLQGSTLTLTNQNSFTGTTTVSGGVLQLNSLSGPALAGKLQVSGGTAQWLLNNQVNSGANAAISSGVMNIGPYNNTFNNLQTTGGTVAGTTGVITSTTDVDARSGTINAILGGAAGLSKTTAGTVVLGAANIYSGSTSIAAGTLNLANQLAVQNSTVSMNGGIMAFATGNTSPSVGALTGTSNLALTTATAQAVALNVGGNGQSTTYSGVMSGIGGLVKQGAGTFALGASQAYSGATVVSTGVLQLGPVVPLIPQSVSGFGANTSGTNGSNATWTVNSLGVPTTAITNNKLELTDNNGGVGVGQTRTAFFNTQVPVGPFSTSFIYQESNPIGYTYVTNGITFVLQNDSRGVTALGGTGSALGYSGTTGFTAVGPSAGMGMNVWFEANNGNQLYWLRGGTLASNVATSPVSPTTGDQIRVNLSYDGSNSMTTTWTDLSSGSAFTSSFAVGDLATILGGTSAYLGFTGAAGDTFTGLSVGPATQTISSFSYSYSVPGAPISGNNLLPAATALSVTSGATVDMYGGSDTVGSLTGAGTVTNSVASTLSVLNVAGSMQSFSGQLQDGAGTLGLAVTAPGGVTLTAANTYSGPTNINGGTLQLGNGSGGNDGSITGTGGVNNNGLLVYNLAGAQTPAYAIGGSGTVTKTGGGTLTMANGGNSYTGGTNILQGLMIIAPGSGALPFGPLNVSSGSLDVEGNNPVVTKLNGNGVIGNGAVGAGNAATLFVLSDGTDAGTFSGRIRDGGFGGNAPMSLQVLAGTLTLSGTNTYSGGTTVNGGTLIVTNPAGIADGTDLTVGGGFPAPVVQGAPAAASSSGVSAVPEPGTFALLAVAATAAAVAARRSRKNRRRA
jgi:autotransporter-associated beta strand protein